MEHRNNPCKSGTYCVPRDEQICTNWNTQKKLLANQRDTVFHVTKSGRLLDSQNR